MNRDDLIWVLGHKNPDTDAICSAIAYANFKNMTDKGTYVPKKAGEMNEETRYVLKTFQCEEPETVFDVWPLSTRRALRAATLCEGPGSRCAS